MGNHSREIHYEVVEDSEPERESLRRRQKATRKKEKATTVTGNDAVKEFAGGVQFSGGRLSHGTICQGRVQDDVAEDILRTKLMTQTSTSTHNRLYNSTESQVSSAAPVVSETYERHLSKNAVSKNTALLTSENIPPHAEILTPVTSPKSTAPLSFSVNSDSGDDENHFKLSQFAYELKPHPTERRQRRALSHTASVPIVDSTEEHIPKKKSGSSRRCTFAGEFSEADLAKLTKCVSCNIKWTTRSALLI